MYVCCMYSIYSAIVTATATIATTITIIFDINCVLNVALRASTSNAVDVQKMR